MIELDQRISQAVADVVAERDRQRSVEGWAETHDDLHINGEIAAAAACYALSGTLPDDCHARRGLATGYFSVLRLMWPKNWGWDWFKPTSPRRDLVRASALLIAEIERLDRASQRRAS